MFFYFICYVQEALVDFIIIWKDQKHRLFVKVTGEARSLIVWENKIYEYWVFFSDKMKNFKNRFGQHNSCSVTGNW